MSKILTTFSGKYGDILWSLPTVKAIAAMHGTKVDFACMPQYDNNRFLELIGMQPYVDKAFPMEDWKLMHSNYGDQPWNPPQHTKCVCAPGGGYPCKNGDYETCYHLGYRSHPGIVFGKATNTALIDFIAEQQGIRLKDPLPFLDVPSATGAMIAYAFNDQYDDLKKRFLLKLTEVFDGQIFGLVNTNEFSWVEAASIIKGAAAFVGCRSANWVIANGVRQQIICYEPHPARNQFGHLGEVFGCPYNDRVHNFRHDVAPEAAAETTAEILHECVKTKAQEQTV